MITAINFDFYDPASAKRRLNYLTVLAFCRQLQTFLLTLTLKGKVGKKRPHRIACQTGSSLLTTHSEMLSNNTFLQRPLKCSTNTTVQDKGSLISCTPTWSCHLWPFKPFDSQQATARNVVGYYHPTDKHQLTILTHLGEPVTHRNTDLDMLTLLWTLVFKT